MKRIEQVLSREIGLMAKSIGSAAIEAAVRGRMASCRLATVGDYADRLEQSSAERSSLIEDIVVSETWFFRDEDVFRDLAAFATGPWRRAHPDGTLRVLCVPCATGEEPYSAAITLLESGLPATRFLILGVDVSQRALERARAAVYGKHAFRAAPSPARDRYFETVGGGRQVALAARSTVTLLQGNVLDPFVVPASVRFDVIFCRNLLIYLDGPARARALDNFWQWLTPQGIFFAGHAEAIESLDPRFQHLTDAGHCAYVRRRAVARVSPLANPAAAALSAGSPASVRGVPAQSSKAHLHRGERAGATPLSSTRARAPRLSPASAAQEPLLVPLAPAVTASTASLATVTELADRGDPGAALACERHLVECGPSAEAYCLLGVLRNAAGAEQAAIEAFNRALYLEQTHYASLIQLALLYERRGDRAAAANFRRRAERVQQKAART